MDNINHQQERRDDSDNHHQHQHPEQQLQQEVLVTNNGASTSRIQYYAPGYRFCPTDEELIKFYLRPKIDNLPLPYDGIRVLDFSSHSPEDFKREYEWDKLLKENEMFVFTSRSRRYPHGNRPNRAAAEGYWKPTGKEETIIDTEDGAIIGYKKKLDYHKGKSKVFKRTHWKMHEYRIDQIGPAPNMNANGEMDKQLDKCVLCKIYLSSRKKNDGEAEEEAAESITNGGDESSPQSVEETSETFVQNQSNNLVLQGTSTASCSSTYEPSSTVQMYGDNTSFINQEQVGNSVMNANTHGQITSTPPALAWPTYDPSSSVDQMFDQKCLFINQSSSNCDRDSNMNGNNHVMQSQINNLASTSPAPAWPMTYNPSSSVDQMFDQKCLFINKSSSNCDRDSNMNGNNQYGQTVQTNEAVVQSQINSTSSHEFGWPRVTYNSSSSMHQVFDQNVSNQSSRKRGGYSNMNVNKHGQSQTAVVQNLVGHAPITSHVYGWPGSYMTTSDQNNSAFHVQSSQIFDQNGSSLINDQISSKRSRNYMQEDGRESSMNANNHGQSSVQTIHDSVVQNQDNNLVSMDPSTDHAFAWSVTCKPSNSPQMTSFIDQSLPNSFQMFDPVSSSKDQSSIFNDNSFQAMELFPPTAHLEPNHHPIMNTSDISDPHTYSKTNKAYNLFGEVQDLKTTLH